MPKATPSETSLEVSQADPTRPRPTSPEGRVLDEHGLPLSGPARIAALDGKPDPALAAVDDAPAAPDAAAPEPAAPAPQQD